MRYPEEATPSKAAFLSAPAISGTCGGEGLEGFLGVKEVDFLGQWSHFFGVFVIFFVFFVNFFLSFCDFFVFFVQSFWSFCDFFLCFLSNLFGVFVDFFVFLAQFFLEFLRGGHYY